MVQSILFDLLTNPEAVQRVSTARDVYAQRRATFSAAMAREDIVLPIGDGINAWVPVADERAAIVSLAAAGIRVAPGSPFQLGGGAPHLRVTVGRISGEFDSIAAALAVAARA